MNQIIITDLTRFKDPVHVCVAGLTLDGQTSVRPMKARGVGPNNPYLTYERCKSDQILPGTIIQADFRDNYQHEIPHIEDRQYGTLQVVRQGTPEEFYSALASSSATSLATGFGVPVQEKYIPADGALPHRSIITLAINPTHFHISFSYDKVRASFTEIFGARFSGVPVTDLGLVEYFKSANRSVLELNNFLHRQNEMFLRVGIGRRYEVPDGRDGFWLQVNGIYTFPDALNSIQGFVQ